MLPDGDDAGEGAEENAGGQRNEDDLPAVGEEVVEKIHVGHNTADFVGNAVDNRIEKHQRYDRGE